MTFPEFNKQNKFNFHLNNIKKLISDTNLLAQIPDFMPKLNHFYTREDKAGWWMATKQIVLRHYINEYLTILGKRKYINLFFIDLLSHYGMNKVTKRGTKDQFNFPGSTINAVIVSISKQRGFSKIYSNDYDLDRRIVLSKRLDCIKKHINSSLDFEINTDDKNKDSNIWVIKVINEIRNNNRYSNYLIIIDNEGMNIEYNTIKKIREVHPYGDIIINFQDVGVNRNLKPNPQKIKKFFGIQINPTTKKDSLCDIYIEQLKKIGFGRIEKLKIASKTGFYYTLLFCCREDVSGNWLEMIKYYRDDRFKSWTDEDVKRMWDVAMDKSMTLEDFK